MVKEGRPDEGNDCEWLGDSILLRVAVVQYIKLDVTHKN